MKTVLSQEEQTQIQKAVAQAEGVTSGEIVPFVVGRSDSYPEAVWKGAVLMAAISALIALLLSLLYEGWGMGWLYSSWGVGAVVLVGGLVGGLCSRVNSVKRMLAGADRMRRRVHSRAMRAFLEEEMFNTRDRTGILLFVSLLEHHIEVIGDEGINKKVETDEWIGVVDQIREGIKSGRLADGIVTAIGSCGDLLRSRKVEIRDDDTDELSNRIRISDT